MPTRKYRSAAAWQTLIEQQSTSGLNGLEFCRQNGLNAKSFYRKRKALRSHAVGSQRPVQNPAFVQVQVASKPMSGSSKILLQYQGCTLSLPESVEPLWVARLMQALL